MVIVESILVGIHSNNPVNPLTYTVESEKIALENPVPKNVLAYTFVRWYTVGAGGTKTPVTEIPKGSVGNLTVYAEFELNSFEVTFDTAGGEMNETVNSYTYEDATVTLPSPVKHGYIFAGWYTNSALTGSVVTTIPSGSVGDQSFYAKWVPVSATYVINHVSATGKLLGTATVTGDYGTTVTVTPISVTGYNAPIAKQVLIDNVNGDTVTLTYEPVTYKATFKADGTTVKEVSFTVEDSSIEAPTAPAKTGFTVVWESYILGTESITVNAVYTATEYTATFVIDGTVVFPTFFLSIIF